MITISGLNQWLSRWDLDEQYYLIDLLGDDVPWILLMLVPLLRFFLETVQHPLSNMSQLRWTYLPFLIFLLFNLWINADVDFNWIEIPQVIQWQIYGYAAETYLAVVYNFFLLWITYRMAISNPPSHLSAAKFKWIKQVWQAMLGLLGLWALDVFWPATLNPFSHWLFDLLWLGIAGFMYWLTYQGILRFHLANLPVHPIIDSSTTERSQSNKSAQKGPNESSPYLRKLATWMEEEEWYRNQQLSRQMAADRLGISPGYLSQLLRAELGQSFPQYVARCRVEAVKKMMQLEVYATYSLLAIGQEAGFSSKSGFYATFKQHVGKSPSEYRKELKES